MMHSELRYFQTAEKQSVGMLKQHCKGHIFFSTPAPHSSGQQDTKMDVINIFDEHILVVQTFSPLCTTQVRLPVSEPNQFTTPSKGC